MPRRRPTDITPPPWPLDERPGFLVRRLHQIHGAHFAERCAQFDVTPVQYSLLSALTVRDVSDLTTLALDVALDRTTTTGAIKRLEARGLVAREQSRRDRRAQECRLTAQGCGVLGAMEAAVQEAHRETLAGLDAAERATWLGLTKKLVAAHAAEATGNTSVG